MAIITPSSVIGEIRGSAAAQTFSRNHYRAYVKLRKAPTDTPSDYKDIARANFTNISFAWQTLEDDNRARWNIYAQQFKTRNRLGVEKPMTGHAYFMQFNMFRAMLSLSMTLDPGRPRNMPYLKSFASFADSTTISTDEEATTNFVDYHRILYCSPPVSAGKMSVNSTQLLFLDSSSVGSGITNYDFTTLWEFRFGSLVASVGKKVFIGVRYFSASQGSITPIEVISTIIQP